MYIIGSDGDSVQSRIASNFGEFLLIANWSVVFFFKTIFFGLVGRTEVSWEGFCLCVGESRESG